MRWFPVVLVVAFASCNSDTPGGPGDDAMLVSSENHDLGTISVGVQTSALVLTFTNTGNDESAALTVFVEGPSADELVVSSDECEGRELAPEESCEITVALRPTFNGAKEVLVRVQGRPGETASATIRAIVGGTTMSASPDGLDFGDMRLGIASPTRGLLIRNASPRPTGSLSVEISGPHASDFTVVLDACAGASISGGFSCGITIRFQPSASGIRTATLRVSGVDAAVSAPLRGTGGSPTFLSITPTQHAFGLIRLTERSTATFTVRNDGPGFSGTLSAQISGVNANFAFESNTCIGQTLEVGASCVISVSFRPQSAGAKTADLTVSSSYAEAVHASVSGEGAALTLAASPPAMAFSALALSASAAQSVTITNTGNVASVPIRTEIVDFSNYDYYYYYTPSTSQFEIVTDACAGAALAPGASCAVSIRYAPRTIGAHFGRLRLFGDAAQNPTQSVDISGTANGIRSTTLTLDFPPTAVGATSAAFNVGIFNSGSTSSGALTTTLSGGGFTIVSDDCAGTALGAGAACTISVRFSPSAALLHHAQITVSGIPGGSAITTVRGQGM